MRPSLLLLTLRMWRAVGAGDDQDAASQDLQLHAHDVEWDCGYTFHDLTFATIYFGLFGYALFKLVSVLLRTPRKRRLPQKFFLTAISLQCGIRMIDFFISPFYYPCNRPLVGSPTFWLLVTGTIPATFFFLAFAILVYTVSRIYHTVMHSSKRHKILFVAFTIVLIVVNIGLQVTQLIIYIRYDQTDDVRVDGLLRKFIVFISSFIAFAIGTAFLLYGWLMYHRFNEMLEEAAAARRSFSLVMPLDNPMKKTAVVATISTLCFVVRAIVLAIMDRHGQDLYSSIVYFTSEVIPSGLMIYVFERASRGVVDRPVDVAQPLMS